jgi:Na+-translocating ferredoxin:NAD+ oxidoreductase RnfC subunit
MTLDRGLRECGVVGAGGAGFPTSVKAAARVEFVIANGAECEPLLHKDAELMKHFPEEILSGLALMMQAVHARRGKFGVKEKNAAAVAAIRSRLDAEAVDLVLLGDFYPSGDEYELVYAATGRLIPPAGIPLQTGCVVNNVETCPGRSGPKRPCTASASRRATSAATAPSFARATSWGTK